MQHVLVYADSLSWGIVPNTRKRLAFDERWPGVMENELAAGGRKVRVIEDCLNGRRTVWDDPFEAGRSALALWWERHSASRSIHRWHWSFFCSVPTISSRCIRTMRGTRPKDWGR